MDGYPHTLNRHDVGWELPRPTNRQDSQPQGTGRRERDHHDKEKRARGRGNRTGPRWKRTFWPGPGDAYLQRPKTDFPHLNWRISPASPHMRPSIHHPSTLYHFSGVAPHGGGNPQSWPTTIPPLTPIPTSRRKTLLQGAHRTKPPTHPPTGNLLDQDRKKKKRGCGIARQQTDKGAWGALEPRKPPVPAWRGCSHVQEPVWWAFG